MGMCKVLMGTTMNRKFLLGNSVRRFDANENSGYYNADANNPYHQDGGYYEGQEHAGQYQDEYYNDQYYDQGAPAAGQQPYQGHGGYASKGKRRGDSEEDSETFSDFTMRSDMARAANMDYYERGDERYN